MSKIFIFLGVIVLTSCSNSNAKREKLDEITSKTCECLSNASATNMVAISDCADLAIQQGVQEFKEDDFNHGMQKKCPSDFKKLTDLLN